MCVFTCQQPADRQVYGHFFLRHLVPERLYKVTSQAQGDWLLAIWETTVTMTECSQTLSICLNQHTLLTEKEAELR